MRFFCSTRSSLANDTHDTHTHDTQRRQAKEGEAVAGGATQERAHDDRRPEEAHRRRDATDLRAQDLVEEAQGFTFPPSSPTVSSRRTVSRVPVLTCRMSSCVVSCSAGRAQQEARGRRTEPGRASAEERGTAGQINKKQNKEPLFRRQK
jgi:hypothetical protein